MLRMLVWTAYSELPIEQQTKYTSKAIAMHSVNNQFSRVFHTNNWCERMSVIVTHITTVCAPGILCTCEYVCDKVAKPQRIVMSPCIWLLSPPPQHMFCSFCTKAVMCTDCIQYLFVNAELKICSGRRSPR